MTNLEGLILPASRQEILEPFTSFKADVKQEARKGLPTQGVRHIVVAHPPGHVEGTLVRGGSRLTYEAKDLSSFIDGEGKVIFEAEEETLAKVAFRGVSGSADVTQNVIQNKSLEITGTKVPGDDTGTLIALSALRVNTITREINSSMESTAIQQCLDQRINIFDLTDLQQRLRWCLGKVAAFLADDIK